MDVEGEKPHSTSQVVLQEMSLGQILDKAIKIYLAHWKTFIAVSAMVMVPYAAIRSVIQANFESTLVPGHAPTVADLTSMLVTVLLAMVLAVFVTPLLTGALARAASQIYLGRTPTMGELVRFALSRFGSLFLVSFLVLASVAGGFLLLIIPGVIFFLRLVFAATVVVVEGKKGTKAMGRSWNLAKGSMGKIFLTIFLTGILAGIAQGIIAIPFAIIGQVMGGGAKSFAAFIAQAAASTIATPFAAIVNVLLYFDMRIRKEAFDLTVMAQELGQQPA